MNINKHKINVKKLGILLTIIFVFVGILIFTNIKDTYSIDANTNFTVTFHQAWGADGESRWNSDNLPKRCTTRYGKVIFDSCSEDVGICYYWAKRKNGDTNHSPIKDSEKIDAVDIKYDYVNNNFGEDTDLYCAAGDSKGNAGSAQELTSVNVTKTWNDKNNVDGIRPKSVYIELYVTAVDGTDLGISGPISSIKLSDKNNWTYNFTDLPVYIKHKKVQYNIKEKPIDGYKTKIDGYNVINTHNPSFINISGKKIWNDNNNVDNFRPESVTIELYNGIDDKPFKSTIVSNKDNWEYVFKDLPEYRAGKKINYYIKEKPIDRYNTKIDGYNVINTYSPETIEISGKKIWNDNDNEYNFRPDKIIVNLYNNIENDAILKIEVSEEDNWEYVFKDLPKYDNGKEISYRIEEDPIEHYDTKIDGYDIINDVIISNPSTGNFKLIFIFLSSLLLFLILFIYIFNKKKIKI